VSPLSFKAPPDPPMRTTLCLVAIGAAAKRKAVSQGEKIQSTLSSTIVFSGNFVMVPMSLLSSYMVTSRGSFFPYSLINNPPSALTSSTHILYTFPLVTITPGAFTPERDVTQPTRILSFAGAAIPGALNKNMTTGITTNNSSNTFLFIAYLLLLLTSLANGLEF